MNRTLLLMNAAILAAIVGFMGCEYAQPSAKPASSSGVRKQTTQVETGADGMTSEQRNVRDRLLQDNRPGAIKHLYVVSAYSGDCILYSTVREKVTSSGKRLSPMSVVCGSGEMIDAHEAGFPVNFSGVTKNTGEVLQDDGTYGSSIEYLFWWDQRGNYHQHYVTGGQIVHVSDVPMTWSKIILNLETSRAVGAR